MERAGVRAAAADRRRDHQPAAHGGEDRAGSTSSRRSTCSTPRARSAWSASLLEPASAQRLRAENRARAGAAARARTPQRRAQPLLPLAEARARAAADRLATRTTSRSPRSSAARVLGRSRSRELVPLHRLDALLPRLGAAGRYPRILDDPSTARPPRELFDDAPGAARRGSSTSSCCAPAASTASCRRTPTATTSCSTPTRRAQRGARALPRCCASRRTRPTASRYRSLADFVAPNGSGLADYLGAFAVTAGHRRRRAGRALRGATTTTTTRSWRRRWPTGWPRRSPSACTSGRASEWGYGRDEQLVAATS